LSLWQGNKQVVVFSTPSFDKTTIDQPMGSVEIFDVINSVRNWLFQVRCLVKSSAPDCLKGQQNMHGAVVLTDCQRWISWKFRNGVASFLWTDKNVDNGSGINRPNVGCQRVHSTLDHSDQQRDLEQCQKKMHPETKVEKKTRTRGTQRLFSEEEE